MNSGHKIVLLDTNVVSYRYLNRDEFEKFRPFLVDSIPAISFVTYAESLEGAYRAGWAPKRIGQYDAYLRTYLLIPADRETAISYAKIYSSCKHRGVGVDGRENDIWIAATAHRHNIPILSNDGIFENIPEICTLPPSKK
jgi:predicted nucleic acid-binding protein